LNNFRILFFEYLNSGNPHFEYREDGAKFFLKVERRKINHTSQDGESIPVRLFKFSVFINDENSSSGQTVVNGSFQDLPDYSKGACLGAQNELACLVGIKN
jgi:hypothetical protein